MHPVYFYRDQNHREPVYDYIAGITHGKGLINWVRRRQILDSIIILRREGTSAKVRCIRHLFDDLWELRLLFDRILFMEYAPNTYVMLHGYNWRTCEDPHEEYIRTRAALEDVIRGKNGNE